MTLATGTTGIIGAMDEEIEALLGVLEETRECHEAGFTVYEGVLEQKQVMIARCGIGKVNAAALTQFLLQRGAARIIFTGVAGGLEPSLSVGDIVISTDALQHDVDVSALGYDLAQVPGEPTSWPADDSLIALALGAAQTLEGVTTTTGRVVSGDQFIANSDKVRWLRDTFAAHCAEMEGASVAQVCARWGVPFVIIRSISDTADQDAGVDFREFTVLAAGRAKQVVRSMLRDLA